MSEALPHPEEGPLPPGGENPLAIPDSPQELLAMQKGSGELPPDASAALASPKVREVLDRIAGLDTTSADDKQIALALLRKLEDLHDEIVEELRQDPEAPHSQIIAWSIDADRLTRARILLESVDLQ